jgi:aminopeptidase N
MVAANLDLAEDHFTTRSGKKALLQIYVEKGKLDQAGFAMQALKKCMRWDEEVFGLELDLERFMIVAVSDFNAGAMENKGLNIFNTKFILARADTATDYDYFGVDKVVAHEYFHNWTGNRVTCRDWFQLSLKEGLTVYRDQEYSADEYSRPVVRIQEVRDLRNRQFPEDAGPMAHPVRPDSYAEINNFYTSTVYDKGAEVVRMYATLLGKEGFRKGMDLYFQRHDGQAVTCDDFRAAMADANGADLAQLGNWYSQAGTPVVDCSARYDAQAETYTLTLRQSCPPTPGQEHKKPFVIPSPWAWSTSMSAISRSTSIRLRSSSRRAPPVRARPCSRSRARTGFRLPPGAGAAGAVAAARLLRAGHMEARPSRFRAHASHAFDSDAFNRLGSGPDSRDPNPARRRGEARRERPIEVPAAFIEAMGRVISDGPRDPPSPRKCLQLPGESYLAECMESPIPTRSTTRACTFMRDIATATARASKARSGISRCPARIRPMRRRPGAARCATPRSLRLHASTTPPRARSRSSNSAARRT